MLFERFGGFAQSAGGINDVIHQNAGLVLYVTDDVHDLGDVGFRAALVDDRQVGVIQALGHGAGPYNTAYIRRNHHEVLEALLLDVFKHNRCGIDVIHRNVEESLNLVCVQVEGQNTMHSNAGDHVSHYHGADGYPGGTNAAILAGVSVIRDNGGDTCCRGTAKCVGHHDQFHQVVVGGVAGGLDDENIMAPDILIDLDSGFTVAEPAYSGLTHGNMKFLGNSFGKFRIGVAGENHQFGHDGILHGISVGFRRSRRKVAGVAGFEPAHDGIKTRCLTTWRHPNIVLFWHHFSSVSFW